MAARTIVTSHPDVACDVCGRRLLRGEQPEVFLGGGHRRLVCELCTTRATHEGWRREAEGSASRPRGERPRGGSLLRGLRQLRWPSAGRNGDSGQRQVTGIDAEWAAVDEGWSSTEDLGAAIAHSVELPAIDQTGANVQRALEVFNAGEHPRRLAGVTRALGAPTVRATQSEEGANVAILVAWELCWYRYEVDLADESRGAWLAAEGMELDELAEHERIPNSTLDKRGELSLLVQ